MTGIVHIGQLMARPLHLDMCRVGERLCRMAVFSPHFGTVRVLKQLVAEMVKGTMLKEEGFHGPS